MYSVVLKSEDIMFKGIGQRTQKKSSQSQKIEVKNPSNTYNFYFSYMQ